MGGFVLVACLVAACCSHRCRAKLFGYTTADAAGDNNNNAATNHDHDHATSSAVSTFSANATTSHAGPASSLARGQGRKQQQGRATALDKDGDMDEWSHTLNEEEEGVRGHGISSLVGAGGSKPTHGKGKEIPLQPLLSRVPVAGHPSAPSPSSSLQQQQRQQQQQQQQQQQLQQQGDFDFSMENPLKQPTLPSSPVAYPFHAPSPPIGGGGFAAHSSSSSSGLSPSRTEVVSGAGFDDPFGNSDPFASAPPAGDDFNAFTNVPLIANESSFTAAGNRTNNVVIAKSASKVPPPNPFQAAPPPAAASVAGSNTASWDWLDQGAAPLPKAP